jgi:hypothetical protein
MTAFLKLNYFLIAGLLFGSTAFGQNPTPPLVIVQAANAPAPAAKVVSAQQDSSSIQAAIKSMQELKAANQEMLKKQEETMERLDETQKLADQLKIFAHRSGG